MRDDSGNLSTSISMAWKELKKFDIETLARKSGSNLLGDMLEIEFLGRGYVVNTDDESIRDGDGNPPNPFFEAIILHYMRDSRDFSPSGKMISFRELYGGDIYFEAFNARAILPMLARFGSAPDQLIRAGEMIGGTPLDLGDASISIVIFPKITYSLVIWQGDEEVPPSGNILFDSTIQYNLPTEDVTALSGMVVSQLIRSADMLSEDEKTVDSPI